jgi:hypothetical protein
MRWHLLRRERDKQQPPQMVTRRLHARRIPTYDPSLAR